MKKGLGKWIRMLTKKYSRNRLSSKQSNTMKVMNPPAPQGAHLGANPSSNNSNSISNRTTKLRLSIWKSNLANMQREEPKRRRLLNLAEINSDDEYLFYAKVILLIPENFK